MDSLDTQFKNFLRESLGARARGQAHLTTLAEIPEALRAGESLFSIAANCAKILNALADAFSFDPWVESVLRKPFPAQAILGVQQQWVLSRIALIAVLEEQLKWLVKEESPALIRISLAHTKDAALALSTLQIEVGGDIESVERDISPQVLTRFQKEWPPLLQFTAKESAFKADPKNKNSAHPGNFQAVLDYQIKDASTVEIHRADSSRTVFRFQSFSTPFHQIAWAVLDSQK